MTYNFYLNYDKRGKPEKAILLYLRENGEKIVLRTGEYIDKEHWDEKKQIPKTKYANSYNKIIDEIEREGKKEFLVQSLKESLELFKLNVQQIVRDAKKSNRSISMTELKSFIKSKLEFKSEDFFEVFDIFLKQRENQVSTITSQRYRTLVNHLKAFQSADKNKITFTSIDLNFIDRFRDFMVNVQHNDDNSVTKQITFLKTFIKWTSERGYHQNNIDAKIKIKYNKVDTFALSLKELKLIEDAILFTTTKPEEETVKGIKKIRNRTYTEEALNQCRDKFVFACYQGLRVSDLDFNFINADDLDNGIIKVRNKKTNDYSVLDLNVPSNNPCRSILKKYNNKLPIIQEQAGNKMLKIIAEQSQITNKISVTKIVNSKPIIEIYHKFEKISWHTARRTCASLCLAEWGLSIQKAMERTGHTTLKAFETYVKNV